MWGWPPFGSGTAGKRRKWQTRGHALAGKTKLNPVSLNASEMMRLLHFCAELFILSPCMPFIYNVEAFTFPQCKEDCSQVGELLEQPFWKIQQTTLSPPMSPLCSDVCLCVTTTFVSNQKMTPVMTNRWECCVGSGCRVQSFLSCSSADFSAWDGGTRWVCESVSLCQAVGVCVCSGWVPRCLAVSLSRCLAVLPTPHQ